MENEIQAQINHEDLVSDAAYRNKRNSHEPMLEGAFKGALASGLAGRVIRSKSRAGEAALIGAGTTLGGIVGQDDHVNKLKEKASAQRTLVKEGVEERSSLASDTLLGGAAGGLFGLAAAPGGISRKKWGLISGAMGATGGLISGGVERGVMKAEKETGHEGKAGGMALALGVGGAAQGAASPYLHKAIGRMDGNMKDKGLRAGIGGELKAHYTGSGILNRIGKGIGWMDDEKSMHEGLTQKKGSKFFDAKMRQRSIRGGLKQGLMGAGVGLGIEHLMG